LLTDSEKESDPLILQDYEINWCFSEEKLGEGKEASEKTFRKSSRSNEASC
jgi:hypothetical protein